MSAVRYLKQIEYCRGHVRKGQKTENPPVKVLRGLSISTEVRKAVMRIQATFFSGGPRMTPKRY